MQRSEPPPSPEVSTTPPSTESPAQGDFAVWPRGRSETLTPPSYRMSELPPSFRISESLPPLGRTPERLQPVLCGTGAEICGGTLEAVGMAGRQGEGAGGAWGDAGGGGSALVDCDVCERGAVRRASEGVCRHHP